MYTTKLGFIKIGHSATLVNKAIYLSCKFPANLQIRQDSKVSQSVKKAKTAVNLIDQSVSIIQTRLAFHLKAKRQMQCHQIFDIVCFAQDSVVTFSNFLSFHVSLFEPESSLLHR